MSPIPETKYTTTQESVAACVVPTGSEAGRHE